MKKNKNILGYFFIVLFSCYSIAKPVNAQMLTESGMAIEQVESMFTNSRTQWRDYIFEEREAGRQAKGWAWDQLMQKQGDSESVMYAAWQKAFDQFGVNLLQLTPTFESETTISKVEFVWRFFPKVEEWSGLDMQNFCETLLKNSAQNIASRYSLYPRCWTTLHHDLKTVTFEMSATVYPK